MGYKNKNKAEIWILILVVLIATIGILSDTVFADYIPRILRTRDKDFRYIVITLFQVQASVSTLALALISILSSFSDKVVYGLPVSRYILDMRPKVLKHKTVIFIELLLLIVSYLLISYMFYNTLIAVFIISIVLILFMINETYIIFYGVSFIKDDVYSYVLTMVTKNEKFTNSILLDSIEKSFDEAIDKKNSYSIKENTRILVEIFEIILLSLQRDEVQLQYWEDLFNKIFKLLLDRTQNLLDIMQVYKYIEQINKILVEKSNGKFYFKFWDNFSREYYKSLSILDITEFSDTTIYNSIRRGLYNSLLFDDEKKRKNNFLLEIYTTKTYLNFNKSGYGILPEYEVKSLWKQLYRNIKSDIDYCYKSSENKTEIDELLFLELLYYFKALIENYEADTIKVTFISDMNHISNEDIKYLNFYYSILIYLYYLSEKEKEALVKAELKEFASSILIENKSYIKAFLSHNFDLRVNNEHSISCFKEILSRWEYLPEESAKFIIMDSCIEDFLIFNALYHIKDIESLTEKLEVVIGNNYFQFYTSYVGDSKPKTKENYEAFLKLFYKDKNDNYNEVDNDIKRLENCVAKIYKIKDIEESEMRKLTYTARMKAEEALLMETRKELHAILEPFNINTYKGELKKKSFSMPFHTHSNFFRSDDIKEYVAMVRPFIINFILNQMKKYMIIEKSNFDKKDFLNSFFSLVSGYEGELNTLIGYKNWFYKADRGEEFKSFESKCKKVFDHRLSNDIVAVESDKVFIRVSHIDIKIEDVNINEEIKKLKTNDEGCYLYNVTNNIYLPYEENELRKYLLNTRKDIKFVIGFEYAIRDSYIGIGIENIMDG